MDNETIKILKEQAGKLPKEVIDFLSSSDWEEMLNTICSSFNLTPEISHKLKREVVLVLAGLIHPDDFREEIKEQTGGDEATIDSIVAEVEEKIFAPIHADLVKFFEEQEAEAEAQDNFEEKDAPAKVWEKMPDVAPDNLPVGGMENDLPAQAGKRDEGEISPIPNLIPKARPGGDEPDEETHPFEEKMKKVFTGASTTLGDLAIETPVPERNTLIESDPYREPLG